LRNSTVGLVEKNSHSFGYCGCSRRILGSQRRARRDTTNKRPNRDGYVD
jgi:hypothetical protein